MVKVKVALGTVLLLLIGGALWQTVGTTTGEDRVPVLLSVTLETLRPEKGVVLLITYKSSSSEWRGPVKHYPLIPNSKKTDPWNKTASVKRGDTVYLRANQDIANKLTCIISVPSMRGVWSEPKTRRSIGMVKCELVIP